MKVFIYFRAKPDERIVSETALAEQRIAVDKWLAAYAPEVIGETIEMEGDNHQYYVRLDEAAWTCRIQDATLLIASTKAIGRGCPLATKLTGVRVIVADTTRGQITDCPDQAPPGVCLYCPDVPGSLTSVQLVNRSAVPLLDVQFTRNGDPLDLFVQTGSWPDDISNIDASADRAAKVSTIIIPANSSVEIDFCNWDLIGNPSIAYRISYRVKSDSNRQHGTVDLQCNSVGFTKFEIVEIEQPRHDTSPSLLIGHLMDCPATAPTGLSLQFTKGSGRSRPVYLCNNTGSDVRDVIITTSGITSKFVAETPIDNANDAMCSITALILRPQYWSSIS